jgi:hypothetical protein
VFDLTHVIDLPDMDQKGDAPGHGLNSCLASAPQCKPVTFQYTNSKFTRPSSCYSPFAKTQTVFCFVYC